MNKKYYYLTALFIITSPIIIHWITVPFFIKEIFPWQIGSNIFLFSVFVIPLILGLTGYLWKLPARPIRIIYLVVLSVSALFNIIPLLIIPFPPNEMGGDAFVLNIMLDFFIPIGIFMGAHWLGMTWNKSRQVSEPAI